MSQAVAAAEPSKSLGVPGGMNPFVAYSESVSPQHIVGKILKFSKGEYLAGENFESQKRNSLKSKRRNLRPLPE